MKLQWFLLFSLVFSLSAGCASRRGAKTVDVTAGAGDHDRLWNAAEDTLRDYRFRLDRVDRTEGIITTLPMGSKHFFELWRKDVATRRDLWESTVNPQRRWVEVRFTQAGEGARADVAVVVHKERLSAPDRQFNSTTAAYEYFSDTLPATTGETRLTDASEAWIDLGRDPALEALLLRRIRERAGTADAEGAG